MEARRDNQDVGKRHVEGMWIVGDGYREVPRDEVGGRIRIRIRHNERVWRALAVESSLALRCRA